MRILDALGHDLKEIIMKLFKKIGYLMVAVFWLAIILMSLLSPASADQQPITLPKIVTANKWWDKVILDTTFREPTSPGLALKLRQGVFINNISYDDPMAFHGVNNGSPHPHCFYGATRVDENTTQAGLSLGRSSFQGGMFNSSALWLECIHDAAGNLHYDEQILLYYLGQKMTGKNVTAANQFQELQEREDFPADLEMVFNAPKTIENEAKLIQDGNLHIFCRPIADKLDPLATVVVTKRSIAGEIPICNDTETLAFKLIFPTCFDGRSKSADGSHMAYDKTGDWKAANLLNQCPSTHPHRTWGVFVFVNIPVPAGTTTEGWALSAPFHFNYMHSFLDNQKTPPLWKVVVDDCFRSPHDCGTGLLGRTHLVLGQLPVIK
jgi:Domain of unknown function (DUF1996)